MKNAPAGAEADVALVEQGLGALEVSEGGGADNEYEHEELLPA